MRQSCGQSKHIRYQFMSSNEFLMPFLINWEINCRMTNHCCAIAAVHHPSPVGSLLSQYAHEQSSIEMERIDYGFYER